MLGRALRSVHIRFTHSVRGCSNPKAKPEHKQLFYLRDSIVENSCFLHPIVHPCTDCIVVARPRSIDDHNVFAQIREAYYAFEALGEHPYDFRSYEHGLYPEILIIGGYAKVATDNVSTAQFEKVRVPRMVDADLDHQRLKVSLCSNMVCKLRLRFVEEAAPTLSPHNRVSNLIYRGRRAKVPAPGSPGDGDVAALNSALGGDAITDLSKKTKTDLENIYRLCFHGSRGITS